MQLIIAEKPSQGRDLAKAIGAHRRLDGGFTNGQQCVSWCIGHLLEMVSPDAYDERYRQWSIDTLPIVPQTWRIKARAASSHQLKILKQFIRNCSSVIIATDADREGEVIARQVLEHCGYQGPIQRLWLSALDEFSIKKAFSQLLPNEKTEPLYFAGLARARADWLVGMNLSRYYTLAARYKHNTRSVLSVGRVQTPTLALVVTRDREIEQFTPQDYWDIWVTLTKDQEVPFKAKWQPDKSPLKLKIDEQRRCIDLEQATAVYEKLQGQLATVKQANSSVKQVPPPLGYDLSTLQAEASAKWGFGADKTLKIAQSLYEKHKVCSYPRTDCRYLPNSQHGEAPKLLTAIAQNLPAMNAIVSLANPSLRSRTWNQQQVDAASHHAIIPTGKKLSNNNLSQDELKIYDRICRQYIAQFYVAHQFQQTIVHFESMQETLTATGKVILEPGWHRVYISGATRQGDQNTPTNQLLPPLKVGDQCQNETVKIEAKKTQPPLPYTEGTLIKAMKSVGRTVKDPALRKILRETTGIGREATRATIINTLIEREYLIRNNNKLTSTAKGRALIDAVPDSVKNAETTAVWEQALDEIAQNKLDMQHFVTKQVTWITDLVTSELPKVDFPDSQNSATHVKNPKPTDKTYARRQSQQQDNVNKALAPICSQCGSLMVKRFSSKQTKQAFWGCSDFPTCRHTQSIEPITAKKTQRRPKQPGKRTTRSKTRKSHT